MIDENSAEVVSREEAIFLKGLAILAIVTHNFLHMLPGPRENEFSYDPERASDFLRALTQGIENWGQAIPSYLGHYGVQVFVFLSAYGLTKSYQGRQFSLAKYYTIRVAKIYPMFLFVIALWLVYEGILATDLGVLGPIKIAYWSIDQIVKTLLLIPGEQPVGPWWFIPFIMQFYLIFPVLLWLSKKFGSVSLLAISGAAIVAAYVLEGRIYTFNIYMTAIGHLPELCLGVAVARGSANWLFTSRVVAAAASMVFVLGNVTPELWLFSRLSAVIVLIHVALYLNRLIPDQAAAKLVLLWLGTISFPLFLIHGFLREPLVVLATNTSDGIVVASLCLLFVAISVVVSGVVQWAMRRLQARIDRFANLILD